jgi:hypothetical protein
VDRGTDALDRAKQPREGMNEPEGRASLLCTQREIIIRIPSGARGYTHCLGVGQGTRGVLHDWGKEASTDSVGTA